MVNKKEQMLLDYMYGQAQNLLEFMRRNGFEEYQLATLTVWLDKDDDRFNSITVDGVKYGDRYEVNRTVRKASDCLHDAHYEEILHGGRK